MKRTAIKMALAAPAVSPTTAAAAPYVTSVEDRIDKIRRTLALASAGLACLRHNDYTVEREDLEAVIALSVDIALEQADLLINLPGAVLTHDAPTLRQKRTAGGEA